jgi:hypothetical protein
MSKDRCKTCGRPVGEYSYGGRSWNTYFDQRVGSVSKDAWLQATSRFNSDYDEKSKKVSWNVPKNDNARGLFCRQMCADVFMEQYNEELARLPSLVQI